MNATSRRIEWWKILEFLLIFVVIPTFIFSFIASRSPDVLKICYYTIVTIFVMQAALCYLHAMGAFSRKRFSRAEDIIKKGSPPVPKATFIVCAYLPNEIAIIEDTLTNILTKVHRPKDGIEVILSYNTPNIQEVELRLHEMAAQHPELILANVHGSQSKTENLNYALDLASGEIIALLDADHMVCEDCLEKAWRWIVTGEDCVQGRCKVRNGGESVVTSLVEVEFEVLYGVSHYAKSLQFDSALFAGSNAYWKRQALLDTRFRTDMLTEDIDSTLRALIAGKKFLHDRSILSFELAPKDFASLWYQRKRWAQGWFQCAIKHQRSILKTALLPLRAKFMWTNLLTWRIIYDVLSFLIFPILFSYWIARHRIEFPMTPYIWFALIFTLASGPFETIAAFKNSAVPKPPIKRFLLYAMMTFPYTIFKNMIQMVAVQDELLGKREWFLSPRRLGDKKVQDPAK